MKPAIVAIKIAIHVRTDLESEGHFLFPPELDQAADGRNPLSQPI
jgi:hypothetical protein